MKKPTRRNALWRSSTSAYSITSLLAQPACPSFRHPANSERLLSKGHWCARFRIVNFTTFAVDIVGAAFCGLDANTRLAGAGSLFVWKTSC
jgi:hypothetical protein